MTENTNQLDPSLYRILEERSKLEEYLNARAGIFIPIKPVTDLPASLWKTEGKIPMVCTDGKCLYFSDVIDRFDFKTENAVHYRTLVRLESALLEFGTFDFDLEKFDALHPGFSDKGNRNPIDVDAQLP